ncbi:MAG: DNA alkylation repair protein [Holosporales bacterium]|nr:DNA alkylation repair protein [Holosporales bacterium]
MQIQIIEKIQKELKNLGSPEKSEHFSYFFKTSPGSYGEHDKFLGISVLEIRNFAKKYLDLSFEDISALLDSEFNESRLLALVILVNKYKKANVKQQREIVDFYIKHADSTNNWNLVDLSAKEIVGDWATKTNPEVLFTFAQSPNMWRRRIAIVGSHAFITKQQYDVTLRLAELFLNDPQNLIHKATGWMLREIGKRNCETLCAFLDKFAAKMPRVMLSYAIEHFDSEKRKFYRKL